jgi:hypothetical protein
MIFAIAYPEYAMAKLQTGCNYFRTQPKLKNRKKKKIKSNEIVFFSWNFIYI